MATVKLFGAFQDMAGWAERDIDADTLGALATTVAGSHPGLSERLSHASTLVILNGVILPRSRHEGDRALSASDEIAFGPPVSGG